MQRSYLDHAATSPMSESVLAAYTEALRLTGNPASTHTQGQYASGVLEQARHEIAAALDADSVEVTFTSGGTESINLALKGMYWARRAQDKQRNVILLTKAEHHATLESAEWLAEHEGASLHWLDVDSHGALQPDHLRASIEALGAQNIALVTFLWANNEVGTISDVSGLCAVAAEHQLPVHVDAVAALGQVPISLRQSGAQAISVSAHKIGGPVGVGALLLARDAVCVPLLHGGSQQRSRAGTQDVAGAHAFAHALKTLQADEAGLLNTRNLRDYLVNEVLATVPEATLRGANSRLLANAHFTFDGCQGDSLLFLLDAKGVSVSVGSACQAGVQEVSHVLLAMGLNETEAIGSLRITLGSETTKADVDLFLRHLPQAVADAKKAGITSLDAQSRGQ